MAKEIKAASSEAASKKVLFKVEDQTYELLGGPNKNFVFKGERFSKEEAGKNTDLLVSLIANGSPNVVKV